MLTPLSLPLETTDWKRLFQPYAHYLAVASFFAGRTPGRIYADAPEEPRLALVNFKFHVILAGRAEAASAQMVAETLAHAVLPRALADGWKVIMLHVDSPDWLAYLPILFPGREAGIYLRSYFAATHLASAGALPSDAMSVHATHNWRTPPAVPSTDATSLGVTSDRGTPPAGTPPAGAAPADAPRLQTPPGIDLLPANAAALARLNPDGAAALSEEMCSERVSVEDFLAQSFGVCLAEGDELVGFCLSEYNLDGCCEVGVGVTEAYRRRGLGTLLTQALLDAAHLRGVHTVGWHCWKTNQASAALARKAGLEWVKDFPVAMIDLD